MGKLAHSIEWRTASFMTQEALLQEGVRLPRKIVRRIEDARERPNQQLGLIVRQTGTSVRVTLCDLSLITDFAEIPLEAQLHDATISVERNHRPGAHPEDFGNVAA